MCIFPYYRLVYDHLKFSTYYQYIYLGKEIDLNDHFIEAAADELDEIFHTAADISFKQMKTKKRNKVSQKWLILFWIIGL
jgi:hypothetical protein